VLFLNNYSDGWARRSRRPGGDGGGCGGGGGGCGGFGRPARRAWNATHKTRRVVCFFRSLSPELGLSFCGCRRVGAVQSSASVAREQQPVLFRECSRSSSRTHSCYEAQGGRPPGRRVTSHWARCGAAVWGEVGGADGWRDGGWSSRRAGRPRGGRVEGCDGWRVNDRAGRCTSGWRCCCCCRSCSSG